MYLLSTTSLSVFPCLSDGHLGGFCCHSRCLLRFLRLRDHITRLLFYIAMKGRVSIDKYIEWDFLHPLQFLVYSKLIRP